MHKKINSLQILAVLFIFSAGLMQQSCQPTPSKAVDEKPRAEVNPAELALEYIENSTDLIKNKKVPTMISAKSVKGLIGGNSLIVDLRHEKDFASGHIPGAQNIPLSGLIDYFDTQVSPSRFDYIVMVCYSGQSASYASSLLRLLGFHNVYAMKFGMSGWHENFSKFKWTKKISSEYEGK